jgi:hypothetical protein
MFSVESFFPSKKEHIFYFSLSKKRKEKDKGKKTFEQQPS